ncbi:hypothetical protein, conserved in T.vivax [Trypanosoma vivax Y486]|uniref:65 kDa invariant surface glycoprotein n=1 Tax=Trypanosoma vivax (strain Y486) TaxID=1055687 RepID=F9WRL9_TRYVY|nr:hypothetical protein, conserved in T.vivax [Trypanosoma vivax Y486]|eukprot:CCD20203.1 hypothetical protein, conserved in T.vivax [Trypanosoma vivax Y486]
MRSLISLALIFCAAACVVECSTTQTVTDFDIRHAVCTIMTIRHHVTSVYSALYGLYDKTYDDAKALKWDIERFSGPEAKSAMDLASTAFENAVKTLNALTPVFNANKSFTSELNKFFESEELKDNQYHQKHLSDCIGKGVGFSSPEAILVYLHGNHSMDAWRREEEKVWEEWGKQAISQLSEYQKEYHSQFIKLTDHFKEFLNSAKIQLLTTATTHLSAGIAKLHEAQEQYKVVVSKAVTQAVAQCKEANGDEKQPKNCKKLMEAVEKIKERKRGASGKDGATGTGTSVPGGAAGGSNTAAGGPSAVPHSSASGDVDVELTTEDIDSELIDVVAENPAGARSSVLAPGILLAVIIPSVIVFLSVVGFFVMRRRRDTKKEIVAL